MTNLPQSQTPRQEFSPPPNTWLNYKLKCQIGVGGIILHLLLWFLLLIVTLGIATPIYTYHLFKTVINSTIVVDRDTNTKVGSLVCQLNWSDYILQWILCVLLTFLTFGLYLIFFTYIALKQALNTTVIIKD
ncbi:hypothetical protein CJP74_01415 [Psittacicella melopsittaci]|uniref:Uncharacterized protein n=1 Tax=Psittacicella melopsittaci TaxID=2028576 RepID=A0A3A1YBT8_9GAMM|nr:DUF6693 family protein [Psittacicella melopsittaci]RIY33674.1 hypothetical protein CJP74_01415 [Psittacicella melopsittaci]